MSKTHFQPEPNHEVYRLWNQVIESYHPMVHKLSTPLQVGIVFVIVDDPMKETALKLRGSACAAIIGVVPTDLRASGGPDVLLKIDGDKWKDLDEGEKIALLDHEAEHIAFPKAKQSPDGSWHPELDSLNRPKVGMALHDWEFGGFNSIVERHGDAAMEKRSIDRVKAKLDQMAFPSMSEDSTVTFSSSSSGEEVVLKQSDFAKVVELGEQLRRKSG